MDNKYLLSRYHKNLKGPDEQSSFRVPFYIFIHNENKAVSIPEKQRRRYISPVHIRRSQYFRLW